MTYTITNTTSGADLGAYEGDTPLDAYRNHLRTAGYRTAEDAASVGYAWDEIPDDLSVEEHHGFEADVLHGKYIVRDPDGGIWWPSDEAAQEIETHENPNERAIEICRAEPMRGEWQQ